MRAFLFAAGLVAVFSVLGTVACLGARDLYRLVWRGVAACWSRRGRSRAAWRRSTRLVVREPQHALAAADDRGVWREADTPASLPLGGAVGLQRAAVETTQDVEALVAELYADIDAIERHGFDDEGGDA